MYHRSSILTGKVPAMMAKTFPAVFLVLLQLGSATNHNVYNICLSCSLVIYPQDCTTFEEIWDHERCSTELLLLRNGSTAYKFGYETATHCATSDSPTELHVRQRRVPIDDISLCHECCPDNLCNRRLCGLHRNNNTKLPCLSGANVSDWPQDVSITYCDEGELCFTSRELHQHQSRPNQQDNYGNYGCASQVMCDHLSGGLPDAGSPRLCQKCCSQDGCNAHICHSEFQNPSVRDIARTDTTSTISSTHTSQIDTVYTDCWDLRSRGGFTQTGIYDIYPEPTHSPLRVRCDMTTDGGGWLLIQRRYNGSVNFTRTLQEYTEGFGHASGEYWLGLELMHILSSQGDAPVQLRVDLCTFNGTVGSAKYSVFSIASQNDTYRLNIGGFSGAGLRNNLYFENGRTFNTTRGTASRYRGGWWYREDRAYFANLNGGMYNAGSLQGIIWYRFGGGVYASLRSSEMKIRPVTVTGASSQPYTCPS